MTLLFVIFFAMGGLAGWLLAYHVMGVKQMQQRLRAYEAAEAAAKTQTKPKR